jgi:hypothetical protein
MTKFVTYYLIVLTACAILFSLAGCFYRLINNDFGEAIFNGVCVLLNSLWLVLFYIGLESEVTK